MVDISLLTRGSLTLLARIGAGDDLSAASMSDRQHARELVRFGLVRVVLHAAGRGFVPTAVGREFLLDRQTPCAAVLPPRQVAGSAPSAQDAQALIEHIVEIGGTLLVPQPDDQRRADVRRLIHAAKTRNLVPAGYRLMYTGRSHGDLIIHLASRDAEDQTEWNRIRLSARQQVDDPMAIAELLRRYPGCFGLHDADHHRAIVLVRHIAEQTSIRRHRLMLSTKADRPRLWLQIGLARRTVTVVAAASLVQKANYCGGSVPLDPARGLLAVVITRDRWHHRFWIEDDRRLTVQAADIVGQTIAGVELDQRIADDQCHGRTATCCSGGCVQV